MRRGLYFVLALFLLVLFVLSEIFGSELNSLSRIWGVLVLLVVGGMCFGVLRLAVWDTNSEEK